MAYAQPQHGGAADAYYQQGQQNIGMEQQYQQDPSQQFQQQQYPQAPPQYGKRPDYGTGEKQNFGQTFKVDKPKLNDIWAAILFLACFAGFVAVSGLSIYGYSSTGNVEGGGIYNSKSLELNTNTIVLL